MMKCRTPRLTCKSFEQQQSKLCKYCTLFYFLRIFFPSFNSMNWTYIYSIFQTSAPRSKILWCYWIQPAWEKLCWSGCRCWSEYSVLRSMGQVMQRWMVQERRDGREIISTPAQSNRRSLSTYQENQQKASQRMRRKRNLLSLSKKRTNATLRTRSPKLQKGALPSQFEWGLQNPYRQISWLISPNWQRCTQSWAASETSRMNKQWGAQISCDATSFCWTKSAWGECACCVMRSSRRCRAPSLRPC